jgi:lipase
VRSLHVESWGDAAAHRVVYLHGITGHGGHARPLAELWLANDHHVLAPDLLGHGASPYEPPWDIGSQLEAILSSVEHRPAAWIGHSYGGRLAFELAARHPWLVERLVLLDPALHLDPAIALHVAEESRADRSYGSFEEAVSRRYTESALFSTPRELVEQELRAHLIPSEDRRWRYRYSQASVIASYGEMASTPPAFTEVTAPTLLVLGARSYLPYDHLLDAHRRAAGDLLEVVVVDGGHTLLWDALEQTATLIADFLAQS